MKKHLLILISSILLTGFYSCNKEEVSVNESKSNLNIITDQNVLSGLLEPVNQPVEFKGAKANELSYSWVYNISPGELSGGEFMSASAVDGYEKAVYIGWHTRGAEYAGYLVSMNIMDGDNPFVMQAWQMDGYEVNDIEVKSNVDRLFVAGSAKYDMNGNSVGDDNAMAIGMDINVGGSFDDASSNFWMAHFYGASANSITYVANESVWLSKGSRGGLTVFRDYDREEIKLDMELSNAKHFDATGDYGVLLAGTGFNESVLKVWDMTNLYAPSAEFTIPYDVTPLGKNSIDVNGDYAYLAMGNDGVVKVDLRNGDIEGNYDLESGAFCNGVAVDWRYIYAAYGADGLHVIDKETFELVGSWDFNGSCNYVKKVGDFLFLANGDTDGLIMLKKD